MVSWLQKTERIVLAMAKKKIRLHKDIDCFVPEYRPYASPCCPNCGGGLERAQYFLAGLEGVERRSDHNWSQETITSIEHFSNVRGRTGGLCLPCFDKQQRLRMISYCVFALALAVLAVVCRVQCGSGRYDTATGFLFMCVYFFGMVAAIVCLCIAGAARRRRKAVAEATELSAPRAYSEAIVFELKRMENFCGPNETVLTLAEREQLH